MKQSFLLANLLVVIMLLSACGSSYEMTFFLVSQTKPAEYPDAKKIGCEEYLVPVKMKVSEKPSLEKTIKTLFEADTSKYPGFSTATALKDKYIILDDFIEPETQGPQSPFRVYLKTAPEGGLSGVCDAPRIKEQITETVRAYTVIHPFQIILNGSMRNWECLGDESGLCK